MAQGQQQPIDPALLHAAIDDLTKVMHLESKNAGVYKLLATAYGMQGDMAMADLFQAERWLASGDEEKAKKLAEPAGSTADGNAGLAARTRTSSSSPISATRMAMSSPAR